VSSTPKINPPNKKIKAFKTEIEPKDVTFVFVTNIRYYTQIL